MRLRYLDNLSKLSQQADMNYQLRTSQPKEELKEGMQVRVKSKLEDARHNLEMSKSPGHLRPFPKLASLLLDEKLLSPQTESYNILASLNPEKSSSYRDKSPKYSLTKEANIHNSHEEFRLDKVLEILEDEDNIEPQASDDRLIKDLFSTEFMNPAKNRVKMRRKTKRHTRHTKLSQKRLDKKRQISSLGLPSPGETGHELA